MKLWKVLIFSIPALLLTLPVYARDPVNTGDPREISIDYTHSRRIPNHSIRIVVKYQEKSGYEIQYETAVMEGQSGFEDTAVRETKRIPGEYIDELFRRAMALDYNSILKGNSGLAGRDGTMVTLTVRNGQTGISLTVWSPDYDTKVRGLTDLDLLLREIFGAAGLEKWY